MSARSSLSGRIVEAMAAVEALEEALRDAADTARGASPGDGDASDGWTHLEQAADAAMQAATQVRIARSFVRGARLRGAEVP